MAYLVCPHCRHRFTSKDVTYRERRKAAGLCVRCPNPAELGKSCCRRCLDKMHASLLDRKSRAKLQLEASGHPAATGHRHKKYDLPLSAYPTQRESVGHVHR